MAENSRYLPGHCPAQTSCWDKASSIPTSAVNIELPALLKQIIHPGLLFITYYNIQEFHLGAMKSLPVKN